MQQKHVDVEIYSSFFIKKFKEVYFFSNLSNCEAVATTEFDLLNLIHERLMKFKMIFRLNWRWISARCIFLSSPWRQRANLPKRVLTCCFFSPFWHKSEKIIKMLHFSFWTKRIINIKIPKRAPKDHSRKICPNWQKLWKEDLCQGRQKQIKNRKMKT